MLQDLPYGRLENEFHRLEPSERDRVICIRGGEVLLHRRADETLELPTCAQVHRWWSSWEPWKGEPLRYVFRLHAENYVLYMGVAGEGAEPFRYENARRLRQTVSKEICFAILTGWHLYHWYRTSRFCGACGGETVHDEAERMMRCPRCGNLIFPRINPAVIAAVTNGEKLLLSKYAGRSYTHYALIAGFTEIGETMEQTVRREVLEEVGLGVKNIRYYKSQPWGVDGNILMGFYCDLDGDDTIHIDERELALAQWHDRNALPIGDDGFSLTREMIRVFGEDREPKEERMIP